MLVRSGFGTFEFNNDFWNSTQSHHRDIFDPNNSLLPNWDASVYNGAISCAGSEEEIKKLFEFMRDHPVKEYIVVLTPHLWECFGKLDRINGYEVMVRHLPDGWEVFVMDKDVDWMRNKVEV